MTLYIALAITISSLFAAGILLLTTARSALRLLVGLEMLASSAAASLVMWVGSLGLYCTVVVLDTLAAAIFAAVVYLALKHKGSID